MISSGEPTWVMSKCVSGMGDGLAFGPRAVGWKQTEEADELAQWVRICGLAEAPRPGNVMEAEAGGVGICLANVNGELSALENLCPHREGPLGQGWIEGDTVVCPWHSWAFHVKTGLSEYPVDESVDVFPLRVEGEDVLVQIAEREESR